MDLIDPLLINSIAENREVILFDNAGVGHSEGAVQETLEAMGSTVVDFLTSIGVSKVDILGFSLGGMIA
jgi:pimeloyl-ACP methyl ester carboxylesterase